MIRLKFILFQFFSIIGFSLYSQTASPWDWTRINKDSFEQVRPNAITELKNGDIVLSAFSIDVIDPTLMHNIIWKASADGKMQSTTTVQGNTFNINFLYDITDIIEVGDSLLFTGTAKTFDSIPALFYFYTDKNLNWGRYGYHKLNLPNLTDGTNWDIEQIPFSSIHAHPDGGYYAACLVIQNIPTQYTDTPIYTFLMRFDEQMQLAKSIQLKTNKQQNRPTIVYNPETKQYFSGDVSGQTFLLDSNLTIIAQTPYNLSPDLHDYVPGMMSANTLRLVNGNYLLSNGYSTSVRINNNPNPSLAYFSYSYIMAKVFDKNMNLIDSTCMRPIDADSGEISNNLLGQMKPVGRLNGFDFKHKDSLFFAYYEPFSTLNFDSGTYTLFMTDASFNLRWAKKMLINTSVRLSGIQATNDGGCLAYGYIVTASMYVEVYIAKHNQFGERTAVYTIPFKQTEMTLYPNPANQYLKLNTSFQNLNISLFTLDGKKVLNTKMSSSKEIDISTLNNGIYFYKITSETNQLLKTGKVLVDHQ